MARTIIQKDICSGRVSLWEQQQKQQGRPRLKLLYRFYFLPSEILNLKVSHWNLSVIPRHLEVIQIWVQDPKFNRNLLCIWIFTDLRTILLTRCTRNGTSDRKVNPSVAKLQDFQELNLNPLSRKHTAKPVSLTTVTVTSFT